MKNINVTISQPAMDFQPRVDTTQTISVDDNAHPKSICEMIYRKCGNVPDASQWFSWWIPLNRRKPHLFSLSAGAVIRFQGESHAYMCSDIGFTQITVEDAERWLSQPRRYGWRNFHRPD